MSRRSRPLRPRPFSSLIGAAALALGCAARSAGPSGAPPPVAAEIVDPPQPGDPVVTLLDAGAEPRAPLRYVMRAGDKTTFLMDMSMGIQMSMGGQALPMGKAPPTRMTMVNEIREVAPSGTTRNFSTLSAMDVLARPDDSPEVIGRMNAGIATLVGMTTDMKITSRGFARDVTINVPSGAPHSSQSVMQALRNATQQASAIFPAEAVGQGARWRIENVIDTGMLKLHQSAIMTLDRRDANRVLLSITVEQTAPAQPFHPPDLPAGTRASVERYAGKGEGQLDVGLGSRTLTGRLAIKAQMAATFVMSQRRSAIDMDLDMDLAFLPAPALEPARAAGY